MSKPSLVQARIEKISSPWGSWLKCRKCGCIWRPTIGPSGHLPRYWYRCPNNCNDDVPPPDNIQWDPSRAFGED